MAPNLVRKSATSTTGGEVPAGFYSMSGTGSNGFKMLYNSATGRTSFATNGNDPSTSPFLYADSNGLITFGPATPVSNNFHYFRGANLALDINATGDKGLGGNCFFDTARNFNRTSAAGNGGAIVFAPNTSASGTAISFYANQAGDTVSTPADQIATATAQGAWSFGDSAFNSGLLHRVHGGFLQGDNQITGAPTGYSYGNYVANVANGGTADFAVGRAFGVFCIWNTSTGNSNNATATIYHYIKMGVTSPLLSSISSQNGVNSAATFSTSFPNDTTIRITNTSGFTTNVKFAFWGCLTGN